MPADLAKGLRLYEDTFNADRHTSETSLANALLTQPDILSPVLTHLAGREDKRFPLSFLTEGMGKYSYVQDVQYDYPVIGRLSKAVACTALISGNGSNFTNVQLAFEHKWFNKHYIIEAPQGAFQLRIVDEGYDGASGWTYTCQPVTTDPGFTLTAADVVGKRFVQMFAANAMSGSRGTTSNWVAPSKARNQISLIRKGYGYEGHAPNRVMNVQFNLGGKSSSLWWDWEEWQHMLKWKEEVESFLWYSVYNRDANGVIHLKDINNQPIPLGAGVLNQIPNYDTYSTLSASKAKEVVRDALYGATDAQSMNITLYTGLGGMEEFDKAMKEELSAGTWIKNTDPNSFVKGSGSNLRLGGFFTSYEHIDGHLVQVRQLPLFDHGPRALASDPHPHTGLPLESYRMVFLDQSVYDGEDNVKMITRKGREMIRWAVAGATVPRGYNGNDTRASDIDGASVHFLKECGIQIRRATNCLHLECVAS